jgi:glucose/arabinose dehydrogenase
MSVTPLHQPNRTFTMTRYVSSRTRVLAALWAALLVTSGVVAGVAFVGPAAAATTPEFRLEPVAGDLVLPVAAEFLPDGRMLVLEKGGRMLIVEPDTGESAVYMTITDVNTNGERGLLSVVVDPDFETNGHFYLYYTTDTRDRNRIARFTHDERSGGVTSRGDLASEVLVWENPDRADSCCHFGGGFDMGPDGALYLTTGEEFDGAQSQDLSVADGKIIRVDTDGSIPADNPFVDDPDALDEIYAYGLRNPYRAQWDLPTGRFFIGEVGGNVDESMEDIHLGRKGANYGWPACEGNCDDPAYDDPIYTYPHYVRPGGDTPEGAVTVGPVYRGGMFPTEYTGALFFADYVHGWVKYLTFDADGNVVAANDFLEGVGAIVDIRQGPEGALYLVDIWTGTVYRVVYDTDNNAPAITTAEADVTSGSVPLDVTFTGAATDANGDDLTYTWTFGDGETATGATVTHTYDAAGSYTAYLEVTDGNATATSEPIRIDVGSGPTAIIDSPTDGDLFRGGDVITFAGRGTDAEDGQLPPEALSWEVTFLHNTHTHPGLGPVTGSNGSFEIETEGHDYSSNTGYRIDLTATDSDGLSDTTSVSIFPDKVDLTLRTAPAGLPVDLDDIPRTTPYVHDTLIGFEHELEAPAEQCGLDGTRYVFDGWSDGGDRVQWIPIPDTDLTLTATYRADGVCQVLPTDGLALLLETDRGVTADGSQVTGWPDQSGNGNDLTALGDPQLAVDALDGQDYVVLDGDGDALVREGGVTGLPTGSADRTVFAVVRYDSVGFGGVGYGLDSGNDAFALGVDPDGDLLLQGWGGANDFPSTTAGTGTGWLVHSVSLEDDQFTMYRDGVAVASGTHTFGTNDDRIVVGANVDLETTMDMDVAAVVVYDRALSAVERNAVESYLGEKYLGEAGGPGASVEFTAPADGTTHRGSVTVEWAATGVYPGDHVHLTLDDATGHTTIIDMDGSYTYSGLEPGVHTVTIRVANADHTVYTNPEAVDTVRVVVPEPLSAPELESDGLVVHLEGGDGLRTAGDRVTSWLDDSRRGNDLAAAGDPRLVVGGLESRDYVAFDGEDDLLAREGGLRGLPRGDDDRTVFQVVRYHGTGDGGVTYGWPSDNEAFGVLAGGDGDLAVHGWNTAFEYGSGLPGANTGWLVQSATHEAGTFTHYRDGVAIDSRRATFETRPERLVVGAELQPGAYVPMDVAAVLIYDRALTPDERRAVESYLATTYLGATVPTDNAPPVAEDDALAVPRSGAAEVDLLANDRDPDGSLDATAVSFVDMPDHGKVAIVAPGVVRYTHMGDAATVDTFAYRVADDEGGVSNPASVTVTIGDGTNQPPTAVDDAATVARGDTVGVRVLDNDGDADGSLVGASLTIVDGPTNGSVVAQDTGVVQYVHDGSATTSDAFAYTVADDDGAVSNVAIVSITVTEPVAGVPTDGLVVRLEAGAGVTTDGLGAVTAWADGSGSGNDLTAAGAPSLLATGTPGGAPAVAFDGVDDAAAWTAAGGLTAVPTGAADRTLVTVVRYDSVGFGGVAYGYDGRNRAFGLVVDDAGNLTLQAWGSAEDERTGVSGTGAGWMVQSARVAADAFEHRVDGSVVDSGTHVFETRDDQFRIGEELGGGTNVGMQVAAVLLYDRALSDAELSALEATLAETYLGAGTTELARANEAPTAVDDAATVEAGGAVRIDVLGNDRDPDGALDASTVEVIEVARPLYGTATVEADGSITYVHDGSKRTEDAFLYAVRDDDGAGSNLAQVVVRVVATADSDGGDENGNGDGSVDGQSTPAPVDEQSADDGQSPASGPADDEQSESAPEPSGDEQSESAPEPSGDEQSTVDGTDDDQSSTDEPSGSESASGTTDDEQSASTTDDEQSASTADPTEPTDVGEQSTATGDRQ